MGSDGARGGQLSPVWLSSPSGPLRVQGALEAIKKAGPCLLVGPRRSIADELVWTLAESGAPTSGVERLTPATLAGELASAALAAEARATVGATAARAVLAQAVDTVEREGGLAWFKGVARLPGFIPSLQRTLEELRFAGVTADAVRARAKEMLQSDDQASTAQPAPSNVVIERAHLRLLRAVGDGPKATGLAVKAMGHDGQASALVELAALAERYETELRRWALADRAWIVARAIEAISEGRADASAVAARLIEPLRGLPQVWFDVPLHSVLEGEFFAAVSGLTDRLTVITPDRDRQTAALVRSVTECDVDPIVAHASQSRLSRVQDRVFAPAVDSQEPLVAADEDASFDFFSSAGEGQEAVEIARRASVLAEEGVRFDEMAVLLRQPGTYLPLVEDAFGRAQIPIYCARGSSRPDPSGRAFLALLACAADGLSATRFAEYLSFDQLPDLKATEEASEALHGDAASNMERSDGLTESSVVPWVAPQGDQLVLKSLVDAGEASADTEVTFERAEPAASAEPDDLGVAGTPVRRAPPAAWERLIVDAAVVGGVDRWRRRIRGLATELERRASEVSSEDEARARSIRSKRQRIADLEVVALPLIERLDMLPEGGSWAEWLEALEQLAVAALRWPRSVLAILAELRPMAAVDEVSLSQVQKVLEEPLRSMEAEPPKRREGKVFVGTIDHARGRAFRVVFLPGLAEGVFPARVSEDPLLLDELRAKVAVPPAAATSSDAEGSFSPLATQSTRFHRERLLLRLAVGAAQDRLVVSYPRVDVMLGRARVPSFYALDLLRAAEGRIPGLAQLAERAAASSSSGARWPAPELAEDAIDDAEFDLSLLHPSQQESGAARFLLFANEHLARSLHARARRWRRPFTWADGLILDNDDPATHSVARALLEQQRPSVRSYSPTALQHFSSCPYRFFLQAVHRLRPSEDRSGFEQIDPLTRGSLFHQVQYLLLRRLRAERLLPVTSSNLAQVVVIADQMLDQEAQRTREEMAPAIERIWSAEVESLRNDLRGWLRQVSEQPHWRPALFELGFGLGDRSESDEASVFDAVEVSGFKLRGSIDLVEVSDRDRRVRVTDHKTGRAYAKSSMLVSGGKILQPLLYAQVAERMIANGQLPAETLGLTELSVESEEEAAQLPDAFREASGLPPAAADGGSAPAAVESGRLYYCTSRGGFEEVEVPLHRSARQSSQQVLETIDDHLREGFLPAAPDRGACRFCDYRIVCGPYEERRIERKQADRLEALRRLRKLP